MENGKKTMVKYMFAAIFFVGLIFWLFCWEKEPSDHKDAVLAAVQKIYTLEEYQFAAMIT